MQNTNIKIAVCSWSLQPQSIDDLITRIVDCGLNKVQLALEPLVERSSDWLHSASKLRDAGIEIVSGMMGCVGEDYSTIEQIKQTGGVMPDSTWPATFQKMQAAAPLAMKLGLKLVTFHAGFIPHDPSCDAFEKGVSRVREVASTFAQQGVAVALETGQEPADALLAFLKNLDPKEVGVNFDPANMLLYGSGEPIAALQQLMPCILQVHIKDAVASPNPGEWGREVPAGKGQVDWSSFFGVLKSNQYSGAYVVEREAGRSRIDDVRGARDLVLTQTRVLS